MRIKDLILAKDGCVLYATAHGIGLSSNAIVVIKRGKKKVGDRYHIKLMCPYCSVLNENIIYADGWAETHICENCKKEFEITMIFVTHSKIPIKKGE